MKKDTVEVDKNIIVQGKFSSAMIRGFSIPRKEELEREFEIALKEADSANICDTCINQCKGKDTDGMCDNWSIE